MGSFGIVHTFLKHQPSIKEHFENKSSDIFSSGSHYIMSAGLNEFKAFFSSINTFTEAVIQCVGTPFLSFNGIITNIRDKEDTWQTHKYTENMNKQKSFD